MLLRYTSLLSYTHIIITWYMNTYETWYMIYDTHTHTYNLTIFLSTYFSFFVVEPTLESSRFTSRFTQKWFLGSCCHFMLFEPWLGNGPGYDTTNTQPDAVEPWIEKMGFFNFGNTTSWFDGNDSEKNIYTLHMYVYIYMYMYIYIS